MFLKMIHKFAAKVCPKSWAKLNTWRAARADRKHWDERIADVLACADNARLKRVPNAGKIDGDFQMMHNGLRVLVNGYYGDGITRMLMANCGCHEPQEEVVFDAIVRTLPPGALMVEAGAYWGFYSMWFCKVLPEAKVYLIEPAAENLAVGQRNFQKNGFCGDFTRAYIGAQEGRNADGVRIVSIQTFLAEKRLERLDVLHVDIQGAEVEMLQGSRSLFEGRAIDYVFISTHSMALHAQCAEFLRIYGYRVLVSVDLEETHSLDGILVACSPLVIPPNFARPTKKPKRTTNLPI
jgi:hypothetical protein